MKIIDGVAIGRCAWLKSQPSLREKRFELFTQKYLKAFIAAALVALLWLCADLFAPPSYSHGQMQAYATHYLNEVLHAQ
jgi:hypothetical protein